VFGEGSFKSLGELATGEQDPSPAAFTFQPDVRAETDNGPFVGAAGVLLAQAQVVVQAEIGKHITYRFKIRRKDYILIYDKLRTGKYNSQRCTFFKLERGTMSHHETYSVEIAGLKRDLRLFEIKPGLKIAILNILGDTELVQACAKELSKKLEHLEYDVLVTAEAKSIPLAYALSVETRKPYVVLRKTYKPYMGAALTAETLSITTGEPQTLILDEKDIGLMQGKKVIIADDVISTGSTLQGMRMILEKAGSKVVAEAAIFTEGDRAQWMHIISLGHLPLFTD
jgi:adenine phosphoribosyltransferase